MNPSIDLMRTGGFLRYLATSSPATSFSSVLSKNKIITAAERAALVSIPLPLHRCLTARISFFGAGADNSTFDYRVWGLQKMTSLVTALGKTTLEIDTTGELAFILGVGTCTLGTGVGITGGVAVASTDRFADTCTWTASGPATTIPGPQTQLETSLNEGTSGAYDADTPNNDVTMLVLPNIGRYSALVIDFDMTGATSANALVALDQI